MSNEIENHFQNAYVIKKWKSQRSRPLQTLWAGRRRRKLMFSVAHHVPGRLRVKSPTLKGKHNGEEGLKERLTSRVEIQRVEVNRITGSVIVHYDSTRVSVHELLDMLCEVAPTGFVGPVAPLSFPAWNNGTHTEGTSPVEHTDHRQVATRAGEIFGKALASVFVKNVLEYSVFSLLTVLLTSDGRGGTLRK
jgi:hypothetical protein